MNNTISKHIIAQYLPPNPIIVEAGAHIGRDTVKMAKLWTQGQIYSFEPVPQLYEHLRVNIKNCPNVKTFNSALAEKSGSVLLYRSNGRSTATSSLLEPQEYLNEMPGTQFDLIYVHAITLDSWVESNNISHINLMWLDMQGGELNALKGAKNSLKKTDAIYTEVNLIYRYKNNPLYPEIKQWFSDQGFTPQIESFNHKSWGNVLFLRKDLLNN